MICDSAAYHTSKKVKTYLAGKKIELVFLPSYSPNLNSIERLWKFMHTIITKNRFYASFELFAQSLKCFFEDLPKYKDRNRLASLIDPLRKYRGITKK